MSQNAVAALILHLCAARVPSERDVRQELQRRGINEEGQRYAGKVLRDLITALYDRAKELEAQDSEAV